MELFSAELPDSLEKRIHDQLRSVGAEQCSAGTAHLVPLFVSFHGHLAERSVLARRGQRERLAERPEAEQTDAELALDTLRAVPLQLLLYRIANVGRDVPEVRPAEIVTRDSFTVVGDFQVGLAASAPTHNFDVLRAGVDAVLDKFRHRLERIVLRQCDDADGRPMVADAQPAPAIRASSCHTGDSDSLAARQYATVRPSQLDFPRC